MRIDYMGCCLIFTCKPAFSRSKIRSNDSVIGNNSMIIHIIIFAINIGDVKNQAN